MFDVSNSVRESAPVQSSDLNESSSFSSMLNNPKQKLSAQFKRAITMIKQRSEPNTDDSTMLRNSPTANDKAVNSFDSTILTSLIEEPANGTEFNQVEKSSFFSATNENETIRTNSSTIIDIEQTRTNLQKIHSSIIQTIHQQTPNNSTSSGTGEITIRETFL